MIAKKRVTQFDEVLMKTAGLNIDEWNKYEIYEPVGCPKCNNSGYKGRLAIHEALYFTKAIREIIVKSGDDVDEEAVRMQARRDGTLNLREAGLEKVVLGYTSIAEVFSATSDE